MHEKHVVMTPVWRDPLCSPGDLFPLGPPRWWWEGSEEGPSADPSVRPFSLRGVVDAGLAEPSPWTYEYRAEEQTAIVRDACGRIAKLAKHTEPGVTPASTTGYPGDGNPAAPPPEEMSGKDYQTD